MASPRVLTLTDENFDELVLHSPVPVLVDFWSEYCAPCRAVAPLVEDLADEYDGQVRIGKVNVEENLRLATEYQISAVPTLVVFDDGQVKDVMVGFKSKRDLKASLDTVLSG